MSTNKLFKGIFLGVLCLGIVGMSLSIYQNRNNIKDTMTKPITITPQSQFNLQMNQLMMAVIRDVNLICTYDTGVIKTKVISNVVEEQEKIQKAKRDIEYFYTELNKITPTDNQKEKIANIVVALSKLTNDLDKYEQAIKEKRNVLPIYDALKNDLMLLQNSYGVGEEIK